jgi:hypothetical protein
VECYTRGRTRSPNLLLRREAPYPLGHTSCCTHRLIAELRLGIISRQSIKRSSITGGQQTRAARAMSSPGVEPGLSRPRRDVLAAKPRGNRRRRCAEDGNSQFKEAIPGKADSILSEHSTRIPVIDVGGEPDGHCGDSDKPWNLCRECLGSNSYIPHHKDWGLPRHFGCESEGQGPMKIRKPARALWRLKANVT